MEEGRKGEEEGKDGGGKGGEGEEGGGRIGMNEGGICWSNTVVVKAGLRVSVNQWAVTGVMWPLSVASLSEVCCCLVFVQLLFGNQNY